MCKHGSECSQASLAGPRAFPASNSCVISHPGPETPLQAARIPSVALESMIVFCPLSLVSLSHGVGFSSSHWCFLVVSSQLYSGFPLGLPVSSIGPLMWVAVRERREEGACQLEGLPPLSGNLLLKPKCPPSSAHGGSPKPVTATAPQPPLHSSISVPWRGAPFLVTVLS